MKLVLILTFISCAGIKLNNSESVKIGKNELNAEVESITNSVKFPEGWSIHPKEFEKSKLNLQGIEKNWYMKKFESKPDSRALESKSESFINSTCRRNIIKQNSQKLIEEAILSSKEEGSVGDIIPSKYIDKADSSNIEIVECKNISIEGIINSCECYLGLYIKGGKATLQERLRSNK